MTWQILLILYLIIGTVGYLLQRRLAKTLTTHHRGIVGFFYIAVHYPIGLIVALATSPSLLISWTEALWILLGSGLFPLINILAFKANKSIDAGLYAIISNLIPIATIAMAYALLNEALTSRQLLGAAIILTATFLATLPRLQRGVHHRSDGVIIALVCVLLSGLAIVYERWILGQMDFGTYIIYGWGAQTLWMIAFGWSDRKKLKFLKKRKNLVPVLTFSLANTLRGLCFVAALQLSPSASIVSVFASFMTVLVVLAAYFFLKEKEGLRIKITAAIVGAIGLIVLNTF